MCYVSCESKQRKVNFPISAQAELNKLIAFILLLRTARRQMETTRLWGGNLYKTSDKSTPTCLSTDSVCCEQTNKSREEEPSTFPSHKVTAVWFKLLLPHDVQCTEGTDQCSLISDENTAAGNRKLLFLSCPWPLAVPRLFKTMRFLN